jgi:hypothetical protein
MPRFTAAIETAITIAAPPAAVWAVLADTARWADWNPFIRSLEGRLDPGARLAARMHPEGRRPMTFRPRVTVAEPGRELRWQGRLILPGLFDGEHWFTLDPAPGGTRLRHGERFSGVLVPLVPVDGFARDFNRMNEALKVRREAGPA